VSLPLRASWRFWALPVAAVVLAATVVGAGFGTGSAKVLIVAALPLGALAVSSLLGPLRPALPFVAILAAYMGGSVTDRIPLGGPSIWVSDIILMIAVAGFFIEWLSAPAERRPHLRWTPVLGIPLLLFTVAMLIAAARGHERYGATLIGMPMRLVGYAVIAFAITKLNPKTALFGLTIALYGGVVYQTIIASYHILTGTSATDNDVLSTGGMRYIGIGPATYAGVTVIFSMLSLAWGRKPAWLHLIAFGLSCYTMLVAYTRTIYLAVTIVLVIAIVLSPRVRRAVVSVFPILTPIAVLAVLLVLSIMPNLVTTLSERVSTPAGQDTSVAWRAYAYEAVLTGVSEERVLGVGFGRKTSFTLNGEPNYIEGDPHNGFIYVYAGGGLFALGAFVLLLLTFLMDVARRWRWADADGRLLLAFCLGAWFVFIGHSASEPLLTLPNMLLTLWILMLLPSVVPVPAATRARYRAPLRRRTSVPVTPSRTSVTA
jgi:O-antigen ligase